DHAQWVWVIAIEGGDRGHGMDRHRTRSRHRVRRGRCGVHLTVPADPAPGPPRLAAAAPTRRCSLGLLLQTLLSAMVMFDSLDPRDRGLSGRRRPLGSV